MSKIEKEGFYFPHFSNARNDRKVRRLRKELNVEGYGIFMMLLEILRDQPDLRYPMSDIDLLEPEIGTSLAKIEAVVKGYDLFVIDADHFFSPKLVEYLEPYFRSREQRSLAGIKSGESRRLKALLRTDDERSFNGRSTVVEQVKERKVKERKVNEMKGNQSEDTRARVTVSDFPTLEDCISTAKVSGFTAQQGEAYYHYRNKDGWMVARGKDGNLFPIANWRSDMVMAVNKGYLERETKNPQTDKVSAPLPKNTIKFNSEGKLIYD